MAILQAMLTPPGNLDSLIERGGLQQHLNEAKSRRLTIVQAPAGYGKTSLLAQWHAKLKQQRQTAIWMALSGTEKSAEELLGNLAQALQHALALGPRVHNSQSSEMFETRESLLSHIANAMAQHKTQLFICLDDLHLLPAAPQSALCQLIDAAPGNVHFLIASRNVPDLHLAKVRARGELLEVSADELKFSQREINLFLGPALKLASNDLSLLEEKTEGWAVALKLIKLSAEKERRPVSALLSSFHGCKRTVSDFFAEEVFQEQPPELQEFLLSSAALEQFTPEMCNAITDDGQASRHLEKIEAAGLFLQHLDDERSWYRYHHLFADFLRRRLQNDDPQHLLTIYLRASKWCWNNGQYDNAINYSLKANDPNHALELLEQRCQDMAYTGKFRLVNKFVAQIPLKLLRRYPRVQLTLAWLATRNLRFEESRELLDNVRSLLGNNQHSSSYPEAEYKQLEYLLLHREMVLAAAHDDAATVETLCHQLLEDFPDENHPYLRGTIYGNLLYARREQFKLNDVEHLQAMAHGILMRSTYTFASIALQASIGPSLYFIGRHDAARRALEQGLEEGIRFGGLNSSLASLPALPLADVLYQENNLERAQELVDNTLPNATEMGFTDELMPGFLTRARICYAKGDTTTAFKTLDEGISLATERKLERLRIALAGETIKLLLAGNHHEQAQRYAHDMKILPSESKLHPASHSTTTDELRALIWVRLKFSNDCNHEALQVAKQWRRHSSASGAVRSLVLWDILLAQLHFVGGDQRSAQRALREAIQNAVQSRQLRSFVDEGPIIHTLLAHNTTGADVDGTYPTDELAKQILAIFDSHKKVSATHDTEEPCLLGRLTAREREILSLIGNGMRNREVAQRLGMTEGSVKWYMQQIYDKVGTRRRMQAVERARQFGLIA